MGADERFLFQVLGFENVEKPGIYLESDFGFYKKGDLLDRIFKHRLASWKKQYLVFVVTHCPLSIYLFSVFRAPEHFFKKIWGIIIRFLAVKEMAVESRG